MSKAETSNGLERDVGLVGLVFYGSGTILGAGIFVVVGEVLGEAGQLAPLAYLLAAAVAVTSALSFAEMAARVPTAAGAVDYLERAFGRRWLGSATGWTLIVANVVSGATITTGFVSYLSSFADVPHALATVGVLALVGGIAAVGMRESTWLMTATTIVGIGALLVILWVLRDGLVAAPAAVVGAIGSGDTGGNGGSGIGMAGLFAGAFLAIYSFIGFGDVAQTAEEVRDVKRTLPLAMMIALAIVCGFYLAISAALVGAGGLDELSQADAPLVRAVGREGWPEVPLAIASLFVILNSALTQIIAASRLLYDCGRDGRGAPAILGRVNGRTNTPLLATALVTAASLALALFVPLKQLATGTSFAILIVFFGVNCALIAFKRRSQPEEVPDIWIGVPVAGAVLTLGALAGQVLRFLGVF
jgi:amino acid transporter